jgi:hypothetical protein
MYIRDTPRLSTLNPTFAVYWICTVNLSLLSLKGNAVLDSKGQD